MVQRFKIWDYCDYGEETITIEGDAVTTGTTFNFFNCEKTTIIIKGKFKNIVMSRCKKVNLVFDELLSTCELLRCENMKIQINKSCPSLLCEISNMVVVNLNEESRKKIEVTTTASQCISLIFPRTPGSFDPNDENENHIITGCIPESFKTHIIEGDKIDTKPLEGLE